jgi:hypothetical protein
MGTNKQPTVTFASTSDTATWDPLLTELNAKGFFCMFQQKLAEGTTMGGGTEDFYVLDLGLDSRRNAEMIIKRTPQLSGRILILGKPDKAAGLDGVVYAERGEVVKTLERLHASLGMRKPGGSS